MSTSGQPLGEPVLPVTATHPSGAVTLVGRYATVTGTKPEHADALFAQLGGDEHAALWDYTMSGPRLDAAAFRDEMAAREHSRDPTFFTILAIPPTSSSSSSEGRGEEKEEAEKIPLGMCSMFRVDMEHRVLEVGSVIYGPALARSSAATEAIYLVLRHAFEDLGFRRCEWKCNALNGRSDRAARRLGFRYEGTFRQHKIVKGRNRDSMWYSMLDCEWPRRKAELEAWLGKDNFDHNGNQIRRLEEFRVEDDEDEE